MMMEKMNGLFTDKTFAEEMKNLTTAEELRAAIAARGVDLTDEEFEELLQECAKYAGEEELTDEQMENTNGGIGPVGIFLFSFGVATAAGLLKDWMGSNKKSKKSKKSTKNKRK